MLNRYRVWPEQDLDAMKEFDATSPAKAAEYWADWFYFKTKARGPVQVYVEHGGEARLFTITDKSVPCFIARSVGE